MTSLGQQSAAGVGTAGMNTGANVATLLGQQGAAQAGGILGQQNALTGGINQAFGTIQGLGGLGKLFGSSGQSGMYADAKSIPMQAGGGF